MITAAHYTVLASGLFCIGLFGVLNARSALRVVVAVELMLNAVNLNLVAYAVTTGTRPASALAFVLLLIVIAAAEVGLALALVVALSRKSDITAIDGYATLKG